MNDIIEFDVIDELGPQTYRGTYEISESELNRPEVKGSASMTMDVVVQKGDSPAEYVADGTASFTADLECSRCVDGFPFANTSTFHVRFQPRPQVTREGEEIEITDKEELDVEFYSARTIPLRDLALEQVQLSIPMKPLCEEECLGLCPQCGANLSREECSCKSTMSDERWGALKDIRDELARKKNV